ncbi:ubiquinol-cytochrome C reductase hinge protein-domain-containing protein [Stachybotrys elegans]|uniref:Cytochrome b-c1 complex subunit 6, mitochondrial n=1 Tax=Stachybotrys elegans TaxID=80388 RepID=A0A8K0WPK8_9HYPO|nr:ubiquinol-cytochrome C reductase hinge protein-domain-containing protein [Stachybotrys elegans]
MGFWDSVTEMIEAATPWSVVEAEAPAAEPKEETATKSESKESTTSEPEAEEAEEAEEEEEEDEEEIVDPKEQLEEDCKNSAQCAPAKHHYDECVERVHQQESEGEVNEDCVEEFFHLAHCATACAAPQLWSKLK